ncbi:MAG: WGR domain-containing protein [Kofleriaceae bacterium]|nr:WGR domain-containing protein [Kofleriaceae bacterium]
MPTHYLLFADDKSHKFWEISYGDDGNIQTRWGKVGTNGQAKTKSLASLEDANKEAAKQIKGKLKKGYEEQDGEAPAAATKTTKAPAAKAATGSKKLPKELVEALKTPSTVTHLSLSKSKLREIPMEVFELTNLEELELDLNDITVLPKEMAKLKKLKKFHILDNPIDLAR